MKYGYARVSTTDQSLDLQLDALRREGCCKIFHDHGVSGVENRRRGLDCLLNDLRKGDQLIVWKLDRLGRSLAFLSRLLDELNSAGVEFKSITDGIDTTTASGKLMFHVIGALSEFERTLISERTKEGMKAAKSRGIHVGRPRSLSPEEVLRLRALAKLGKTQLQLAHTFSVSINTVARALKGNHYLIANKQEMAG